MRRAPFLVTALTALVAAAPAHAAEFRDLVGTPAPGFRLPSDRGGQLALADYRGKRPVLLAFFPKAFTPG